MNRKSLILRVLVSSAMALSASSVFAFEGIVLQCTVRVEADGPKAPVFGIWKVTIPPSGDFAYVVFPNDEKSKPVIYRGALMKADFMGANDMGMLLDIRRKDGHLEAKPKDSQLGLIGDCIRGSSSDLF